METNGMIVPATEVVVARNGLNWTEKLTNKQRTEIGYLVDWCNRNLKSTRELCSVLRQANGTYYSADAVRKFLSGERHRAGENLAPMLQATSSFVELDRARQGQATNDHVDTRLCRKVAQVCNKAISRQGFGFVFGDARIGKTWSLRHFMANEMRVAIVYVEVSGPSLTSFLAELREAFGISTYMNNCLVEQELIKRFDGNTLLIVDEAQNGIAKHSRRTVPPIFRFLKTLWNKSNCPIVISMTDEGLNDMINGPHRKFFEQILGRKCAQAKLPRKLPDDDLEVFAAHYGLPPAPDKKRPVKTIILNDEGEEEERTLRENPLQLQSDVNSLMGLAVWLNILKDAREYAQQANRKITWGTVILAWSAMRAEAEVFE